jgi:hypothetical protein
MGRQIRLLFGISVFWLALSVLTDGTNTLVLPLQINRRIAIARWRTSARLSYSRFFDS